MFEIENVERPAPVTWKLFLAVIQSVLAISYLYHQSCISKDQVLPGSYLKWPEHIESKQEERAGHHIAQIRSYIWVLPCGR